MEVIDGITNSMNAEMGRSEGGKSVAVRDSGMSEYIGVPGV
jgi:hypothetical protein